MKERIINIGPRLKQRRIDIIDELKMCSSEEIATVKKIVDAFVLKKTEPY